jgi:sugar lactone lactonase YvrE
VISNLTLNTHYRIKATAYRADGVVISVPFQTDITVAHDDRPTFTAINIQLIDKQFAGEAASSIEFFGRFTLDGSTSIYIPKEVLAFAGNGAQGIADGLGTAATLDTPRGIAMDAQRNLYVSQNHAIRKISPDGTVSTFAGGNTPGYQDGSGADARFEQPQGLAMDASGSLFVADYGNRRIRKIDASGSVTTFVGNDDNSLANGNGTAASFNAPTVLALDANGNLYVADSLHYCIRKVTAAGDVTTLAGGALGTADGNGVQASFSSLNGLAIDASGNLYAADTDNHRIRKVTPQGVVTTWLGSGNSGDGDGTGLAASFNAPKGLSFDTFGNLYIVDSGNGKIRQCRSDGVVVTLAGNGSLTFSEGMGASASLNPLGVFAMPMGPVFVADPTNHRILSVR